MHRDSSGPFRCNIVEGGLLSRRVNVRLESGCRHRYAVLCSVTSAWQHAARQRAQSAHKEPLFEHACVHRDSSGRFPCNIVGRGLLSRRVNVRLESGCRHRYAVLCSVTSAWQHAARQRAQSAHKEPLFEHACVHRDSSGPFRCNIVGGGLLSRRVNVWLESGCRHRYAVLCSVTSAWQHAARQRAQSAHKEPLFEHACVHRDSSGPFRCNIVGGGLLSRRVHVWLESGCRHRYAVLCSVTSAWQHAARQRAQSAHKEPLFEHACVHRDSSGPFRCNIVGGGLLSRRVNVWLESGCRHRYAVLCSVTSAWQHAARQRAQSAHKEPLFEHACVHRDSSGPFRCNIVGGGLLSRRVHVWL